MNGWTKDLSQQERDENELRAIVEMLQSDPANEYWRARFEGVPYPVDEAQEAEEIGEVLQWLPRPTYDELIAGATFTDEHRTEIHAQWNEKYK